MSPTNGIVEDDSVLPIGVLQQAAYQRNKPRAVRRTQAM
jgi:hypothetical protein